MKTSSIITLNQLNAEFYSQVKEEFNVSRQQPWEGWNNLRKYFEKKLETQKEVSVLDIGCGNGRFGLWLANSFPNLVTKIKYYGIDTNDYLLEHAQKTLYEINFAEPVIEKHDVISSQLQKDDWLESNFDVIVLFGVMHHLPSEKFRTKLISNLTQHLNNGGYLIFSCWNFLKLERFRNAVPLSQTTIIDDAEERDYILDWRIDTAVGNKQIDATPQRYAHAFASTEIAKLAEKSKLNILETFQADGKNNASNTYFVCQKKRTNH